MTPNFSLAKLFCFFLFFQEPFEFESFTHTQNKKPHSKGLHLLLHAGLEKPRESW